MTLDQRIKAQLGELLYALLELKQANEDQQARIAELEKGLERLVELEERLAKLEKNKQPETETG